MVDYTKLPDAIILNSSLEEIDRISADVYEYLKWERNYRTIDTFEFQINKNKEKAKSLLSSSAFAIAYYDGVVYRAGLIEQIECEYGDESVAGEMLKITGRAGGLLSERICLRNTSTDTGYDTQTGTAETVMRHLVDVNCINAVDGTNASASNRVIPNLQLGTNHSYGNTVTVSARFDVLSDILEELALAGEVGWDITYDRTNKKFTFVVLQGTDHTSTGTFPVIFKPELNNILSLNYLYSKLGTKSICYVGGQGEDASRTIRKVYLTSSEPSGYNRREMFDDQRQTDDTDELDTAGKSELEEYSYELTLDAELSPNAPLQYQVDYNIGDFVTVDYTDLATMDVRIITVTDEIIGGSRGDTRLITLTLGTDANDIRSIVKRTMKKNKSQLQ